MTTPHTTHRPGTLRRVSTRAVVTAAGLALLVGVSGCGSPDVTATRIADSLAPTFADLYTQQATLLGTSGVTATSTAAHATCKKGGPTVADTGPGSNWACMVDFTDATNTHQSGKFELQVKSDACWTATGPSKLIGLATLTDTTGQDVTNPVSEFDGCFNPRS